MTMEAQREVEIATLKAINQQLMAERERLRATLTDLKCAFSKTSEIPETAFTLRALGAIRRVLSATS